MTRDEYEAELSAINRRVVAGEIGKREAYLAERAAFKKFWKLYETDEREVQRAADDNYE